MPEFTSLYKQLSQEPSGMQSLAAVLQSMEFCFAESSWHKYGRTGMVNYWHTAEHIPDMPFDCLCQNHQVLLKHTTMWAFACL